MSGDEEAEDDDDCLEFIDPLAEEKAKLAEVAADKEKDQKPKMVKINGKLVPANTISMNGPASAVAASTQGNAT